MDPRQPPPIGVPFTRNVASPPYGRSPFPPTATSTTTTSPFPPASHPQSHPASASPVGGPYSDHQRRSSESHFFAHQQRPSYSHEPPAHSAHSHARHHSSSSVGAPMSRSMAPPSPPPSHHPHQQQQQPPPPPPNQQQQQQPPAPQAQPPPPPGHSMGHYGVPPAAARGPPVNLGPPSAFPSGRELPALGSLPRTGNMGGSMSISALLGGPVAREQTPGHASNHTAFPPPPATTAPGPAPGPAYANSMHASPRMQNATDYNPYGRRPQTPTEHMRQYDPRDQRGSVAGSPPQAIYGTPEVSRFGTPQAYPPRGPPMGPGDERRDQPPRASAASLPPRPNSQPRSFPGMPGRPAEMGRGPPPQPPPGEPMFGRREEMRPGQVEYNPERPPRSLSYEEQRRMMERDREMREHMDREAEYRERDRIERARFEEQQRPFMSERERMEREHLEREHLERERMERERMERDRMEREREMDLRERARRDRTPSDPNRPLIQRPIEYGPPGPGGQPPHQYGRGDPREGALWQQRPGYDQAAARGPYEQQYPAQRPNEYPSTTGPPFERYTPHTQLPPERYPPGVSAQAQANSASQPGPPPAHAYGSPDRHRFTHLPPHQQAQHRARPHEEGPPPPSVAYNGGPGAGGLFESARPARHVEEGGAPLARQASSNGFLAVGEINRKGRVSPLPQAVQGAQPLHQGPAGEPGIKSEFGRMFSGIGSGASGLGFSSPVPSGANLPFTNSGLARRDDVDTTSEGAAEPPTKVPRKRTRKVKEDDAKGDEESNGRSTPVGGRSKRPKTHAHHHHHYHHHHHHHGSDRAASPLHPDHVPLKNIKSGTPVGSPTSANKDLPLTHSHQIPRSTANTTPAAKPSGPIIVPKSKRRVTSQAVLDSVAHKPRKHLGDVLYSPILKPAKLMSSSRFGFSSTPRPLPVALIKDNENSTLTVKISRVHLTPAAREEITSRRAVWGTDVYTDDSDVVAACIHAGWIRGEWPDDVDANLLELQGPPSKSRSRAAAVDQAPQDVLTAPPATGPVQVPLHRDLQVTVLILPALEKYASTTRFGIQSREFGGTYNGRKSSHDGISFMVTGIRWVDGAAPQSRLRGKARRERIRKAMGEVHRALVIDLGEAPKKNGETRALKTPRGEDGDKENRPLTNGHGREDKQGTDVEAASPAKENGNENGNGNEDTRMREDEAPDDTDGKAAAPTATTAA